MCRWLHTKYGNNESYNQLSWTNRSRSLKPKGGSAGSVLVRERGFFAFNRYAKKKKYELVWKITPKIVPCGSKIVEMAAYITADIFNEGTASLLYYMSTMELSLEPNAHLYAQKEDAQRLTIFERRAQESTREKRMIRRQ